MHIKHFYDQSATSSLNAALLSLVPAIVFVIIGVKYNIQMYFYLMTIPFLLYSLVCYQMYLVQKRRYNELAIASMQDEEKIIKKDLFETSAVLLSFLPAPSLRMLLFEPGGSVVGEVRDVRFNFWRWFIPPMIDSILTQTYGVYNAQNKLLSMIKINAQSMKIYSHTGELLWIYKRVEKKRGSFMNKTRTEMMNVDGMSLWCDYAFSKNNNHYGTLKKGWMPLEWTSLFKDPNMPVIIWEKRAEVEDQIAMLAWAAYLFANREH